MTFTIERPARWLMMRYHFPIVLVCAAWVGGCSIYPLPEDVTSFRSEDIVRITRCQARDAVRSEIQRTLSYWPDMVVYDKLTGAEFAEVLRKHPERYNEIDLRLLAPEAAKLYQFYADTTISYDFTIDSTEMNSAGVSLSLLKTFAPGSNTFGVKLSNDRTREVRRQTRNYDSFDNLARKLPNGFCDGLPAGQNPIYPSTGISKIRTSVRDFVDQNEHENLGSKTSAVDAELSDTIVFTTKTTGNLDPTFATNAVPGVYVPSSLAITADNYRQDVHTIIVLIQLLDKRDKIVLFDAKGNISSIGEGLINAKFNEIKDNRYKDDFNKINNNLAGLLNR